MKIVALSEQVGMAILVAAFLSSLFVDYRLGLIFMAAALLTLVAGYVLSFLFWLFRKST